MSIILGITLAIEVLLFTVWFDRRERQRMRQRNARLLPARNEFERVSGRRNGE